jgi:hypothetical protein
LRISGAASAPDACGGGCPLSLMNRLLSASRLLHVGHFHPPERAADEALALSRAATRT